VSQAVALSLRDLGIRDTKILVIHNGITDPAGPAALAPRCKSFRIGIVGQVGPWKGHDDLLEAFALVRRTHVEAELHIFGKGDPKYKDDLMRRCVDLDVVESVTWHDFVRDRQDIYPNLDVCVMPSRIMEPFGLAALEAGFFCTPAIVTRQGGLPEIIEHEVNGLLVEADRPAEIAEALSRLIEQPALRRLLAANARQRAVERFGSERFLTDFLALLNPESQTELR
jgi:glycosyltransferase involved in cell wall biosynthesis